MTRPRPDQRRLKARTRGEEDEDQPRAAIHRPDHRLAPQPVAQRLSGTDQQQRQMRLSATSMPTRPNVQAISSSLGNELQQEQVENTHLGI